MNQYFGLQMKPFQEMKVILSDIKLSNPRKNLYMIIRMPNARTKCHTIIGSRGVDKGENQLNMCVINLITQIQRRADFTQNAFTEVSGSPDFIQNTTHASRLKLFKM